MVKSTFEGLLEKKVNADGSFCDRYQSGVKLIEWLTGSHVQSVVQDKLKDLSKDIDNQITKAVNAGIRENVANKFAEMVVATARANNQIALEQTKSN